MTAGRTLAAGRRSRERLARWLGVSALTNHGVSLTAAAWVADRVEIEVVQPDGEALVLVIERSEPNRPALVDCGEVALRYLGREIHPMLDSTLRRIAPHTLGRIGLEGLARLIAGDPESGQRGVPLPLRPADEQQRFEDGALLSTWGGSSVWRQFRAVAEISRAQLDSLDYFNDSVFVQHSDAECVFLTPQTGVPMIPLALYPWDDRIRRIDWRRSGHRREPDPSTAQLVTTDLDERDVILGRGPARLDAALSHLETQGIGDASMIFCANTCVPVVAGEDLDAVLTAHKGKLPAPILHLTTTPHSMQALLRPLLVERRLAAEERAGPPQDRSINLFGFADDPSSEELIGLLAEVGLSVNVSLIPAFSPDLVDALPDAELSVVLPNDVWRAHIDQLLFDSRTPSVVLPAPCGPKRVEGWLTEIQRHFGLDSDIEGLVQASWAAHEPEWRAMVARARAHRLGFVVDGDALDQLLDPAQTWGFPIFDFLTEMGFQTVLMVASSRGSADPGEIGEVHWFETPEELSSLLSRANLSAVFSEQFYDRRLTELGLSTFSLQHFELGLGGAIRTLIRLVEVCELPFNRRYGRSLARAACASRGLGQAFGPKGS